MHTELQATVRGTAGNPRSPTIVMGLVTISEGQKPMLSDVKSHSVPPTSYRRVDNPVALSYAVDPLPAPFAVM